jgi:hypothetical protein
MAMTVLIRVTVLERMVLADVVGQPALDVAGPGRGEEAERERLQV